MDERVPPRARHVRGAGHAVMEAHAALRGFCHDQPQAPDDSQLVSEAVGMSSLLWSSVVMWRNEEVTN